MLFGVSKYIKAATSKKGGEYEYKKSCIYKFSYIWWLRNLLICHPIVNNKYRSNRTYDSLVKIIYCPKTSYTLLAIGKVANTILGVKDTKCK